MDCSKTIDFFSEFRRLCDSRATCEATARDKQCPLYDFCELAHSRVCANDAIMAMEALQKLSNEHPVKTYAQDFFEKFPIVLPCKVGDRVYRPSDCLGVVQFVIISFNIYESEMFFTDDSENIIYLSDIGKTVFLTREEAEQALKEREKEWTEQKK